MNIISEPNVNYSTGYIKLYRSLRYKGWYKKGDYIHLWVHLLLKANHKENEWLYKNQTYKINSGQFVTSRKTLSEETGINESKIERILSCFENEQQIEQQNLHVNRLITITYWNEYQKSEQQNEQRVNSERTASEQRVDTNKNDKNDKNDKNGNIEEIMEDFRLEVMELRNEYSEEILENFWNYWSEPNKTKTKMRKDLEKTWDTKRRLKTWVSRSKKINEFQGKFNTQSIAKPTPKPEYYDKMKQILAGNG